MARREPGLESDELRPEEFAQGASILNEKITRLQPRWLAVVGITAYRVAFGRPGAAVGPHVSYVRVRTPDGQLSFVYKAAAEIGELGDNTQRLRTAIREDELLHLLDRDLELGRLLGARGRRRVVPRRASWSRRGGTVRAVP